MLRDLKKTYTWLSQRAVEAAACLASFHDRTLWLNIDDPRQDTWVWRTSSQLVFDLQYDFESGNHYDVKQFLIECDLKPLILAAGGNEHRHISLEVDPIHMAYPERYRSGWENLRQEDILTDVAFELQGASGAIVVVKAHKAMLAAMIPHFTSAFRGDFRESRLISSEDTLAFPLANVPKATPFTMKAVVGM